MENLDSEIKTIINHTYPHIKELNPAQKAVLEEGYLEKKNNFIVAIPTASGKTVVGMLAALKTLLSGGKVVYAVPLISIQNEKVKEFKKFEEHNIKVGKHPNSSDLAVMVFESFDHLTRFSWNTLQSVDLLIVDEFHMIGEYSRGPTIESAITRSKMINPGMRIIALSATLSNMEEICGWLNADVVEHDYRPVPLNHEVLNTEMFNTTNKNDVIIEILKKAMENKAQALAFVSTRLFTEALAKYVSDKIKRLIPSDKRNDFKQVADKLLNVPKRKGSRPTSICLKLAECVENGVAFHHAGLFAEQKEIIEDEFRAGNILMITATPSLMYGVNLPSQSVIIRDYTRFTAQGIQKIPVFDYEQMSGRAGRPQYDDVGYSYLIAKSYDEAESLQNFYIDGEIEPTNSKLIENKDSVYLQIISQISSSLAKTNIDLIKFFKKTFYGYQMKNNVFMSTFADESLEMEINESLNFLIKNGLLQVTPSGLKTTALGLLVSKSNYTIKTAVKLKEYIEKMESLKIYDLIYYLCNTPDMPLISFKGRKNKDSVHEKLSEKGIFVRDMSPVEATAVCLFEWIEEKTEYQIENKYPVYSASTRRSAYEASRLIDFFKDICEILGVYTYSQDLDMLSARLYYGVNEELIPLVVGIKRLGRKRARLLVDAFGEDLRPYTAKELQKIEGIGERLSESIVKFTRRE